MDRCYSTTSTFTKNQRAINTGSRFCLAGIAWPLMKPTKGEVVTYTIGLKYKSAKLEITVWEEDNLGSLSDVFADYRRRGHATALLTRAIAMTDSMKLNLILEAFPFGDGPKMNLPELTEFYRKFGFELEPDSQSIMTRKAR
jgi:GNAT superfamily N-acetyltransferase